MSQSVKCQYCNNKTLNLNGLCHLHSSGRWQRYGGGETAPKTLPVTPGGRGKNLSACEFCGNMTESPNGRCHVHQDMSYFMAPQEHLPSNRHADPTNDPNSTTTFFRTRAVGLLHDPSIQECDKHTFMSDFDQMSESVSENPEGSREIIDKTMRSAVGYAKSRGVDTSDRHIIHGIGERTIEFVQESRPMSPEEDRTALIEAAQYVLDNDLTRDEGFAIKDYPGLYHPDDDDIDHDLQEFLYAMALLERNLTR